MNQVRLKFKCNQSWSTMAPCQSGRFCASCQKVVFDFTGKDISDSVLISAYQEQRSCGNFNAAQLEAPFGDWRDKFILFYHKISNSEIKKYKRLMLFFITASLFLTGCYRTVRGEISVDANSKINNNTDTSSIQKMDTTGLGK